MFTQFEKEELAKSFPDQSKLAEVMFMRKPSNDLLLISPACNDEKMNLIKSNGLRGLQSAGKVEVVWNDREWQLCIDELNKGNFVFETDKAEVHTVPDSRVNRQIVLRSKTGNTVFKGNEFTLFNNLRCHYEFQMKLQGSFEVFEQGSNLFKAVVWDGHSDIWNVKYEKEPVTESVPAQASNDLPSVTDVLDNADMFGNAGNAESVPTSMQAQEQSKVDDTFDDVDVPGQVQASQAFTAQPQTQAQAPQPEIKEHKLSTGLDAMQKTMYERLNDPNILFLFEDSGRITFVPPEVTEKRDQIIIENHYLSLKYNSEYSLLYDSREWEPKSRFELVAKVPVVYSVPSCNVSALFQRDQKIRDSFVELYCDTLVIKEGAVIRTPGYKSFKAKNVIIQGSFTLQTYPNGRIFYYSRLASTIASSPLETYEFKEGEIWDLGKIQEILDPLNLKIEIPFRVAEFMLWGKARSSADKNKAHVVPNYKIEQYLRLLVMPKAIFEPDCKFYSVYNFMFDWSKVPASNKYQLADMYKVDDEKWSPNWHKRHYLGVENVENLKTGYIQKLYEFKFSEKIEVHKQTQDFVIFRVSSNINEKALEMKLKAMCGADAQLTYLEGFYSDEDLELRYFDGGNCLTKHQYDAIVELGFIRYYLLCSAGYKDKYWNEVKQIMHKKEN